MNKGKDEKLVRKIVDLAIDAVLILNSEGRIIHCLCRPSFHLCREHLGKPVLELWLPELRREGERIIGAALQGREIRGVISGWKVDGKTAVVSLSLAPLEENSEKGIVLVVNDVTREIEAEKRVSTYIHEIMEYVKYVERSNQLKDTFADIMRHDILNPLSAIKSVVSSGRVDSRGLELIKKSVDRIEKIVTTFSKYALLQSIEELDRQKGNLTEMLDEVVDTLAPLAAERGIRIVKRYPAEIEAWFSPFLEEAVANLLSNAIKFSPPGGEVTLEVRADELYLTIMVRDLGAGVPDRYKRSIFERFVSGKKAGIRGTGLGLAIVKRIAELHSGKVWVEDNLVEYQDASGRVHQEKRGSVFVLRIPRGVE